MLLDTVLQAVQSLGDNRLRTVLSILGITIGIASVMAVSTISKGGNHVVFSELSTFGLESVWVNRDPNREPARQRKHRGSGILNRDIRAMDARLGDMSINRYTPLIWGRGPLARVHRGGKELVADVMGVGANYLDIVNDTLAHGRGIMPTDIAGQMPVAVLAPGAADHLFGSRRSPLGQMIRIEKQRFMVVGVLSEKNRDFLKSIGSVGGRDANNRVLLPYTSFQRLTGNREVQSIQLEVTDMRQANYAGRRLAGFLAHRNPGYAYRFETMESHIKTTNRILGGVATVGVIAASISLLVGGMGIMNMMGTSVLERTREIGIRKALGARESHILNQFLIEACLISIIGGVLGLLIGAALSVGLAYATDFPVLPSYGTILGAFVVSVLVGIVSGYLPARRAAKLHPVTSLRTE